jgi:hypothetical protein
MRYHVYGEARYPTGPVAAGTDLDIYDDAAHTITSSIYAAASGGSPLTNPYVVPATGIVDFWSTVPQPYDIAAGDTVARPLPVLAPDTGADTTGTVDATAALNAFLLAQAGGTAHIPAGTYLISAPLVIYSNTKLELDPAATIKLATGSNCNMLRNFASAPQRIVTDAVTVIGDQTMTSATANFTTADVGRTVVVPGGRINSAPLVANIVTRNSASSVELSVAAGASGTGLTCNIHDRDSNIIITGGTWDRQAEGGAGIDSHSLLLRHIDGLTIRDFSHRSVAPAHGYGTCPGDVTDFLAENLHGVCNSAIVQVEGPAENVIIRNVFGTTADNAVAFTTTEGGLYSAYRDVCGDITDVLVENICAECTIVASVGLATGDGTYMTGVSVRGIGGAGGMTAWSIGQCDVDGNGVNFGSVRLESIVGSGGVTGSGQIDELTIRDITFDPTADNYPCIMASVSIRKLSIGGARCKTTNTSVHLVDFSGTITIDSLDFSDLHWDAGPWSTLCFISEDTTTINRISLDDVLCLGLMWTAVYTADGATVPIVQMSNLAMAAGSAFVANLATTTELFMTNVHAAWNGVCVNTGAAVTVLGAGIDVPASQVSGGTLSSRSLDFPVDVSLLTPHNGDRAYNTNGSLACGVGPCVCDGTHWKNLYTGTATA